MRQLRDISILVGESALAFLVLNLLGIVGVFYRRSVDNDPLVAPVKVIAIEEKRLVLEDGRVIVDVDAAARAGNDLPAVIRESGGRIDLEVEEGGYAVVLAKRPRFICELGRPSIIIPLIPCDVPRYARRLVAWGRIETTVKDDPN